MKPQRYFIPSDLVLRVDINDLYDADDDPITINDVTHIQLTFTSGGASEVFEINPSTPSENPSGASIVTPEAGKGNPYIIVCLCTKNLKPGQLTLRSDITIPDTRFHDNERHESDEMLFPITLA